MTDNIDTIRNTAQKAQERAQKAQDALDEAEQARANAEALQAEQKAIEDDGKNAARFLEFRDYLTPITAAKEAFEQTVRDGGDTVAAWVNVRKAESIADAEYSALTRWKFNRENQKYENAVNALRPLRERMLTLWREASGNKWDLPSKYPSQFKQRVVELNQSINEVATEYGSDYRRELTSISEVHLLEIVDTRPSETHCHPDGWRPPSPDDATPYHVALEQAIRKTASQAAAEHVRTRLQQ